MSASKPPALWRVDGKTLIQKYESIDGERRYKCVNTYSGWTANTRYAHRSIFCAGCVDIFFKKIFFVVSHFPLNLPRPTNKIKKGRKNWS